MSNKNTHKTGFTIVELLLYMSLLTVFVGVLTEIFVSIMKSQIRSQTVSRNAIDARFIMQRMFFDFGNSTDLDSTIATFSTDTDGNLFKSGDKLNSLDSTVNNLTFTRVDNSVQIKFDINNQAYQTTFNGR